MKKSKLKIQELEECLYFVTEKLNEKVDYSIFFGTLLGMIRDKSLIENDDDIDLLLDIKDKKKILEIFDNSKLLIDINLPINKEKYFLQGIFKSSNQNCLVDFYFYEDLNKKNIILKSYLGNIQNIRRYWMYIEKELIFPFSKSSIDRINYYAPKNSPETIKFLYGKKWNQKIAKDKYVVFFLRNKPTYITNNILRVIIQNVYKIIKLILKIDD